MVLQPAVCETTPLIIESPTRRTATKEFPLAILNGLFVQTEIEIVLLQEKVFLETETIEYINENIIGRFQKR